MDYALSELPPIPFPLDTKHPDYEEIQEMWLFSEKCLDLLLEKPYVLTVSTSPLIWRYLSTAKTAVGMGKIWLVLFKVMDAVKELDVLVQSYDKWKTQGKPDESILDLVVSRVSIYYSEKVFLFMKRASQTEALTFRGDSNWFYGGTLFDTILPLVLSGQHSDNYQQLLFDLIVVSNVTLLFSEASIQEQIIQHFISSPRCVVSELMVEFLFHLREQSPSTVDEETGEQWLAPMHPLVLALTQNISAIANCLNKPSLSLTQKRSLLPFFYDLFANHSTYADTVDFFSTGDCPQALVTFLVSNPNCNVHHLWITGIFEQFFYFFPDTSLILMIDQTNLINHIHATFQPNGKQQLRGPMLTLATVLCQMVDQYPSLRSHIEKKKRENQKFQSIVKLVEEDRIRKEDQLAILGEKPEIVDTKAFEID
eukprot:TRINITY_DN10120_c0_g3_i2.p1 TRINITY_DN10120_c0_g3~~TRINITY_DN10120_c0_g3_i2.p1  ORF type:complete len:424 (+),score=76.95 TRINITY_DN10120_c0_g3_i2:129-1400(+)